MGRLFQNFFTNRAIFYNLFDTGIKNVVEMANLLVKVVNTEDAEEREVIFKHIKKLESNGDNVTHKIYLALDKVFFTPINRKDIHTLASSIDDVADYIHEASERMYLYNVTNFVAPIKSISKLILNACYTLQEAVGLLQTAGNNDTMILLCRKVKQYESESDLVYYHAVAELFLNETDAIQLIKYREIFYSLETTTNSCKSAGDALETILINSF